MGILARAGDLVYTFRFLRLLTTAWKDTTAFKLGLIDENGKRIKDAKITTSEQKLKEDKIINSTCHEGFVYRGDKVRIVPESDPQGEIFGVKVYNAIHYATGQIVYVTANELVR